MADYRDYWEETFGTVERGGELDITSDAFLQEADIDRETRNRYETRFIDEVYGTDEAQADTWMVRNEDGLLQSSWGSGMDITYGLDLRRVLNDDLTPGDTDHYEWLTRGEVDWSAYATDNAYKRAFEILHKDKDKSYSSYNWTDFIDQAGDVGWNEQTRIDFIRDANREGLDTLGDDEDDKWAISMDFDNAYVKKYHHDGPNKGQPIDPEAVQPYEASNLFDPAAEEIQSRLIGADGNRMTIRNDIATPSSIGSRRDVQGTANRAGITIRDVRVTRPTNLPASWGPIAGGN